jgi:hypothetical protein
MLTLKLIQMKKLLLLSLIMFFNAMITLAQSYEIKVVTIVESIIPSGLGRSRMVSSNETRNFKEFTSTRGGEDDDRNKSDRDDIRVSGFEETKLLNFVKVAIDYASCSIVSVETMFP